MPKLKKFIGTGAVITALFTAPISFINQSTPALSQNVVQVARGSTPIGNTAWQEYGGANGGIFVDVNTSSAGFTTTPIYITSLGGLGYHWETSGATSIYTPTPTGFRVYVRFTTGRTISAAFANQNQWHINWIAVPR